MLAHVHVPQHMYTHTYIYTQDQKSLFEKGTCLTLWILLANQAKKIGIDIQHSDKNMAE